MFRLGVTGGIGSGKSTICKIFNVLGIPHFSADDAARNIMDNDLKLRSSISDLVGKDIFQDGILDRKKLAHLIFNNSDLLSRINQFVHPLVFSAFSEWSRCQSSSYVIMEAAILFESGGENHVDRVTSVIAPFEERIMRVVERNAISREDVLARIKNQIPESELIRRSDWVIDNSENMMVIPQVLKVHNEILSFLSSNI